MEKTMDVKRVYMNVSMIIGEHFTNCNYWERLDGGEITQRRLSLAEAHRLMWELKLAGADKTIEVNPYNPKICFIEVVYWARR